MAKSEEILMMGGPIILEELPEDEQTGKTKPHSVNSSEGCQGEDPVELILLSGVGNSSVRSVHRSSCLARRASTRRGEDGKVRKAV